VLATSVAAQDSESAPRDWQDGINEVFGSVNNAIGAVFFYPIPIPFTGREIPLRAGGTVSATAAAIAHAPARIAFIPDPPRYRRKPTPTMLRRPGRRGQSPPRN